MHRDPETGQFVADDGEEIDLVYTDHEFVNLSVRVEHVDDPTSNRTVEVEVDDSVLALENDELAELGWMTARLAAMGEFTDPSVDSAEAGDAAVRATVGSNLSGAEYLHSNASTTGVNEVSADNGIASVGSANDDPGVWAKLGCFCGSNVIPPDNGAAGAVNGGDRLVRRYHEETMGGPYIDASDDITAGISVEKERNEENIDVLLQAQMAFIIYEYEHRRAEFAPYGPGPTV